jgi:hypothetical protein
MINRERALIGFALMWKDNEYLNKIEDILISKFDEKLAETEPYQLGFSKYYISEMGEPLYKKFVILKEIIYKPELKDIKLYSMDLEKQFSENGKRKINIDPFYIDLDQLVVATKKYRGNRIYIGDGIYIEMELWYHNQSYQPFLWTYLDYKEYIPFFNKVRNKHIKSFKK